MKYFLYVVLLLMFVFPSCSSRKRSAEYNLQGTPSYDNYTKPERQESAKSETIEVQPNISPSSSRTNKHEKKELDNMRGFDPASEDDMDDNGMQRYFDAYDDESWD